MSQHAQSSPGSGPPPEGSPGEVAVGYSPCPNDTFIFHALVTGRVDTRGVVWRPRLADIEQLNEMALRGVLPFTKISFHAFGTVRDAYALLASGAALGRGCGPLLLAREGPRPDLAVCRIAIPGRWTTAALLLRLYAPRIPEAAFAPMRFDRIVDSVVRGEVDAGVIIHESRFTYAAKGLTPLVDLGAWWEEETGLPVPLGAIAGKRSLPSRLLRTAQETLRESVRHARAHPGESRSYVLEHAQEVSGDVVDAHVALYVNDFTEDLGEEGLRAVETILEKGVERGLFPRATAPLAVR